MANYKHICQMFASNLTPEQELFLTPYFEMKYGSQNDNLLIHIVRYYRVYNCTPEIITRLLKYISINSVNKNDATAFMVASRYAATTSSIEAAQTLINAGADLNLQNKDGWTALMLAAKYSNTESSLETVKTLINAGANLNLQNNYGWTALMLSAGYSNTDSNLDTVQALINAGANLDLQDSNGYTAFMLAARFSNDDSNLETVQALINAGANLNLKKSDGETAADVATAEAKKLLMSKPPSYGYSDHPPSYRANFEHEKNLKFVKNGSTDNGNKGQNPTKHKDCTIM